MLSVGKKMFIVLACTSSKNLHAHLPCPMRSPVKSLTLVAIQFICLIALVFTGPLLAIRPVLLMVQLIGAALGGWAIFSMRGGPFHIVPDPKADGALVQHGPYRLIRHPMYAALLLATLPLVVEWPTPLRWMLWVILCVDLVVKLSYEESLLLERHPNYRAYQQHTKRLIPYLF